MPTPGTTRRARWPGIVASTCPCSMAITDPHWPRVDHWLAREDSDPEVLVVGVPSSKASLSPSRADLAPLDVRDRLGRFSTFHSETETDFGEVTVRDLGNWPVSELDMEAMPRVVMEKAGALPKAPLTLFIGGDNAITRAVLASCKPDILREGR